MNHTDSRPASFNMLQQATAVVLLFQAVFMLAQIFNDGEKSGAMTGILAATLVQAALVRRLSANPQGRHATFYIALWRYGALTLLGVLTLVVAFDTYAPEALPSRLPTLIAMLVPAVLALKGAALGKLKPNRVLGLRLRWTRQSPLAWEMAHRLMGRMLFFGGLISLVAAPFVPFLASIAATGVLVLISVTAGIIKSWRVWQSDPERGITG
jgi:uncharacterized membrane protein